MNDPCGAEISGKVQPCSSPGSLRIGSKLKAVYHSVRLTHAAAKTQTSNMNIYVYTIIPPTVSHLLGTLVQHNAPDKIYRTPYFSKEVDVPEKPREYAGLIYQLKGGEGLSSLEEWSGQDGGPESKPSLLDNQGIGGWEFASSPPSVKALRNWLQSEEGQPSFTSRRRKLRSQVHSLTALSYIRMC